MELYQILIVLGYIIGMFLTLGLLIRIDGIPQEEMLYLSVLWPITLIGVLFWAVVCGVAYCLTIYVNVCCKLIDELFNQIKRKL